jgi:hypothetical protein
VGRHAAANGTSVAVVVGVGEDEPLTESVGVAVSESVGVGVAVSDCESVPSGEDERVLVGVMGGVVGVCVDVAFVPVLHAVSDAAAANPSVHMAVRDRDRRVTS